MSNFYTPKVTNKLWGIDRLLFANETCSVHHLSIEAGRSCSLHRHATLWNRFDVIAGDIVLRGPSGPNVILSAGQCAEIPPGDWHQFEAMKNSEVIETCWAAPGVPFIPTDIERANA